MAAKHDASRTTNSTAISNKTTSYADSGNVTESHVNTLSNVGNSTTTIVSGIPAVDASQAISNLIPNIGGSGTGALTSSGGAMSSKPFLIGGGILALVILIIMFRKKA